jgi:hypothetical protein
MIENIGSMSFEDASTSNIPVDIWVSQITDKWTKPHNGYGFQATPDQVGKYIVHADNYMPRRGMLGGEDGFVYGAVVDTLDEVREIFEKYIIPLYETALAILKKMAGGNTKTPLYHWQDD